MKNCENMKEKNVNKEAGRKYQTQLKTAGHNVEARKNIENQAKKIKGKRSARSQRSKLAADAT